MTILFTSASNGLFSFHTHACNFSFITRIGSQIFLSGCSCFLFPLVVEFVGPHLWMKLPTMVFIVTVFGKMFACDFLSFLFSECIFLYFSFEILSFLSTLKWLLFTLFRNIFPSFLKVSGLHKNLIYTSRIEHKDSMPWVAM